MAIRPAIEVPAVPARRPWPRVGLVAAVPADAPVPAAVPSDAPVPAAVVARLGPAYQAARGLTDPGEVEPGTLAALAPFGALTPEQVATLPAAMQYAVPTVSCAQLNARPPGDDPGAALVACEHTGTVTKYLLDPAA